MLDADHFAGGLGGDFGGGGFSFRAENGGGDGSWRRRDAARRREASQLMRAILPARCSSDNQDAAHRTRTSYLSFSTRAAAASLGVPVSICVDFCFWARAICSSTTTGAAMGARSAAVSLLHFLGLGALDAHQRGVAELVAAGLNGEDGRGGELDGLEPAFFEFALDFDAGFGFLDVEDERGVGQAEEFGDDDAGLAEAEIFRLQAGEDEVGIFLLDGGGEQAGDAERVAGAEIVAEDVDGAVGAFGEGFADGGSDALGAGAEDDDFAVARGLLFELQGFFKGVGVGLVQGVLEVGFFNPFAGGVDADRGVALGNLFDGDDDFHGSMLSFILAGDAAGICWTGVFLTSPSLGG